MPEHATALPALSPAPLFDETRMVALSFLARYNGGTRRTYESDLKLFFGWCASNDLPPLQARRQHLDLWVRWMTEVKGHKPSTVSRRITTVAGFYRVAYLDEVIDRNPADHVRRPKVPSESTAVGLDRWQFGQLLHAARQSGPKDECVIALLGLLGLRVSEACAVQITDLDVQRGHRVLSIIGKGSKPAVIPLPPAVWRAFDACRGDRTEGPLLVTRTGRQMDRAAATRIVKRLVRECELSRRISPHSLRHTFATGGLQAGVPLRDMQIGLRHADPRTTTRYDRAKDNLDRHPNYTVAAYLAGSV